MAIEDEAVARQRGDVGQLEEGGTLAVLLGRHALTRGYRAAILTYNLQVFDPTWFDLPSEEIRERLAAQAAVKKHWRRLQAASRGYDEFLRLGGKLRLRDLEPALLRKFLKKGIPVITGLSATYLYRAMRDIPETNQDDDVRGDRYNIGNVPQVLAGRRADPWAGYDEARQSLANARRMLK